MSASDSSPSFAGGYALANVGLDFLGPARIWVVAQPVAQFLIISNDIDVTLDLTQVRGDRRRIAAIILLRPVFSEVAARKLAIREHRRHVDGSNNQRHRISYSSRSRSRHSPVYCQVGSSQNSSPQRFIPRCPGPARTALHFKLTSPNWVLKFASPLQLI